MTRQRAQYLRRAIPRLKRKRRRPLILITFPDGQTIGPYPVYPFPPSSLRLDNSTARFTRTGPRPFINYMEVRRSRGWWRSLLRR